MDMGRGDLSDAEWERQRPFLPVSDRRCGRWPDHRQVIDVILHQARTGVQWRDLPERFGPWKTVYDRQCLAGDGGDPRGRHHECLPAPRPCP
ncbi:transposase [Streptomyces sp. NPDC002740]